MKQAMKLGMVMLLMAALSGCAHEQEPVTAQVQPEKTNYVLVVKDTTNPYMQRMGEGFLDACASLNVQARVVGPDEASAEAQAEIIEGLVAEEIGCLAVAANESDALDEVLQKALAAGIRVVSMDAAVNPQSRVVHIQQANPEMIGRILMQASHHMTGGKGEIAFLSTSTNMPNQAIWLEWMQREVDENPEKYADMPIVDIVYGMDEYEPSAEATRRLLAEHPNLSMIIAPTAVGLKASADVLMEKDSKVLVTGLGLPSQMAKAIQAGKCPWMYLWNPIDIGYLAAHTLSAIDGGMIMGAEGEALKAGRLGEKQISPAADGGTEIVLGYPFKFDTENITLWMDAF